MRSCAQSRRGFMSRKIVEKLIAGVGVNEIARQLHVGKERIRKVRERAQEVGYLNGSTPLPPYPERVFPEVNRKRIVHSEADRLLSQHVDWIKDRFAAGWHAVTIFEELPVKVERSSFYRFVKRHALNPKSTRPSRVVPEIVHKPGEALQVDWGKIGSFVCPVTGKRHTVWAFVGVLGFSRYRMVRVTTRLDLDSTLSHLESMLVEIGGVPAKLTSDNPKVFALQACRYDPLLNPVYERFAAYYGTTIECLPPADPEKKGKVERPMPFIRRLLEPYTGSMSDLKALQTFIDKQLSLANDRRHGTTGEKPVERFIEGEASALKPLPKLSWQKEEYHHGLARKDGHVRFRGKYYSVAETFIGKQLEIIANENIVWIYHAGQLIETHTRCYDSLKSKSTKAEHLKPWERAMTDTSVYRARAKNIGPHVDEMVVRLIGNGLGVIDFRKVWGLLSLDKSYSAAAIDNACKMALEVGSARLRTVRTFLEMSPQIAQAIKEDIKPSTNVHALEERRERIHRFTRDMKEYGAIVAQATKH